MAAGARSVAGLTASNCTKGRLCVPSISRRRVVLCAPNSYRCCSLSMNGCGGDSEIPVKMCDTLTFPAVSSPAMAMTQLNSAISALKSDPPAFSSGIIRLEVPIKQQIEAISWLHAQRQLPRCFFSGRVREIESDLFLDSSNGKCQNSAAESLVSIAGVGSAVSFRGFHPFSLGDWRCIKRYKLDGCTRIMVPTSQADLSFSYLNIELKMLIYGIILKQATLDDEESHIY